MKAAEQTFKVLDKIAFVLTALCVAGMTLCVFIQVVARFTSLTIAWTTELSQYFFLWSTTFASYVAARRGKLIGVELVQKMFPSPVQRILKFLSWGTAAFFYGFVIYVCGQNIPKLMKNQTPVLKWSMGMVYIIMLIGLGLVALYSVYLMVRSLLEDPKAKDNKEKTAEEIAEEVE